MNIFEKILIRACWIEQIIYLLISLCIGLYSFESLFFIFWAFMVLIPSIVIICYSYKSIWGKEGKIKSKK
jgi:hypothetical protein